MKVAVIIDDEVEFRTLLAKWMADSGWKVLEADDGEVGTTLVLMNRPDVVICDLLMPRCNGFQVCRSIRAHPETLGHTRVIVTTGSDYASDRINAIEAGANAYMVKPIKPRELTQIVTDLMNTQPPKEEILPGSGSNASNQPFEVRFWGVRGSIPTPGPATIFYGGNTSCVEVRGDGEVIILDAGTGIRPLGQRLAEEFKDKAANFTILISHTHWDHIQGFPFFIPAYNPKNRIRILGYDGARRGLETTLSSQMESPYFPIGMRQMPGNISVHELKELEFSIGAVKAKAMFLNHPGICMGFRLYTSAGSVAYLPDNEPYQRLRSILLKHSEEDTIAAMKFATAEDQKIIEFISEADVLIIDAQYDDAEYQSHVGWGHGCVDDVVALAIMGKVKRLFLFHHDPDHDDRQITRMVEWARELVALQGETLEVEAAREGHEVVLMPTLAEATAEEVVQV